ncbi:HAD family phosphatase [uncultured Mucilaginibacter sp.]|uniref:HAD family hydrolase n=1 Tax=uncultured Mucilaginibacter sp. TaxID=797541 RepID=UPI0025F838C4|nr:HAD family phosphatase [uncultured Mucilaginibacter sp.]
MGTTNTSPISLTQPSPRERALNAGVAEVLSFGEDLGEVTNTFGAIFDMDGTLIDNTPYHFKSWQALYKKYDKGELSKETYYARISGVPVLETIRRVFGEGRDELQLKALLNEKEEFYRQLYAPLLAPINGLENFLTELKNAGVKMAMGTSATQEDIDFVFNKIPIEADFDAIINSTMVTRPKPDPQVFLKAAQKLGMPPEKCVVFEDSLAGVKAANSAGMKVVGITTGHTAAELQPVNLVINDYSELTVHKLAALFEK